MDAEKLLLLATHLESGQLSVDKFDFGYYRKRNCKTVGCAAGELPSLFPEAFTFVQYYLPNEDIVCFRDTVIRDIMASESQIATFFGITSTEFRHLFRPCSQIPALYGGEHLGYKATKEEVATNIREFVTMKLKLEKESRT